MMRREWDWDWRWWTGCGGEDGIEGDVEGAEVGLLGIGGGIASNRLLRRELVGPGLR